MTEAGVYWVGQYPTSRSVEDLAEPFRRNVRRFLAELAARGCSVRISATRRPRERAFLMHWTWQIVKNAVPPHSVPVDPAIPIVWSVAGASAMFTAYGLAYRPSLTSMHIRGEAIDMTIRGWSGLDEELYALGAMFGVLKLRADPPHWSSTGR